MYYKCIINRYDLPKCSLMVKFHNLRGAKSSKHLPKLRKKNPSMFQNHKPFIKAVPLMGLINASKPDNK